MHDAHLSGPMTRVKRVSIVIGSFLHVAAEMLPCLVEYQIIGTSDKLLLNNTVWWSHVVRNNNSGAKW